MIQPIADNSYKDLLPQSGTNNHNFCCYISSEHILLNYSARFLVFNDTGRFIQEIGWNLIDKSIKKQTLKLLKISDDVKYFLFEGPVFASDSDGGALTAAQRKTLRRQSKMFTLNMDKKDENPDEYPESAFYIFELKQVIKINGEMTISF